MNIGNNELSNFGATSANAESTATGFGQSISKQPGETSSPQAPQGFSSLLVHEESQQSLTEELLVTSHNAAQESTNGSVSSQANTVLPTPIMGGTEQTVQHSRSLEQISATSPKMHIESASNRALSVSNQVLPASNPAVTTASLAFAGQTQLSPSATVESLTNGLNLTEKLAASNELKSSSAGEVTLGRETAQTQLFKATMPSKDTRSAEVGQKLVSVLADKIQLQSSAKTSNATIRLDPPDLGKLDLFVRIDGDRLNVHINSSATSVRDAISQTVERLRLELIQENFLEVNVSVGDGEQSQPEWKMENQLEGVAQNLTHDSGESQAAIDALDENEQVIARV